MNRTLMALHIEQYYSKQYPNYSILKKKAIEANINGDNIINILENNSNYKWLEGVKEWYSMNLNRNLTTEQAFHTIFMCLDDLKKGEESFSKQPLNMGTFDNLYDVPKTAQFILLNMMITPNYVFVSKSRHN